MKTELWAMALVLLGDVIGAFGPIYLKRASASFSFNPLALMKNLNLWRGLSFYAAGTVLFVIALKGGEISVLYPLVAMVYVCVSFLSLKMLNEKMNRLKWLGILFIVLGTALIGFS